MLLFFISFFTSFSAISKLDENERLQIITIYQIKEEPFNHFIEVQGDIKSRKNLILLPELNGILKNLYVEEGGQVNEGDLLAEIDDSGLKNQLSQLELQAELSRIKFNRIKNLWEQKIGSEIEYLEAKTIYKTQQKIVAQLKEQLKKTKIIVSEIRDEQFAKRHLGLDEESQKEILNSLLYSLAVHLVLVLGLL